MWDIKFKEVKIKEKEITVSSEPCGI